MVILLSPPRSQNQNTVKVLLTKHHKTPNLPLKKQTQTKEPHETETSSHTSRKLSGLWYWVFSSRLFKNSAKIYVSIGHFSWQCICSVLGVVFDHREDSSKKCISKSYFCQSSSVQHLILPWGHSNLKTRNHHRLLIRHVCSSIADYVQQESKQCILSRRRP